MAFLLAVGCKSCVWPVSAVLMTAGPDVIRRSGPYQNLALAIAAASKPSDPIPRRRRPITRNRPRGHRRHPRLDPSRSGAPRAHVTATRMDNADPLPIAIAAAAKPSDPIPRRRRPITTRVRPEPESAKKKSATWPSTAPAARDRKSTRLNSSHIQKSRMPSSA